ncbi:MAP kinase-activated protein kinase 2 (Fragment) [Seminavis robusta]|uniref:MAP kinase-activated protein kinase 2 n=1 Tax=Seminavis robusta TaxID=568900 RepID=A0A9N8F189_9STRA
MTSTGGENDVSRHSISILDLGNGSKADDASTDGEDSFHDEDGEPRKSAADVLEGSLQSLSIQNGGTGAGDPSLSPPPSIDKSKRKLGKDFLKVLEKQSAKDGMGSKVSQLSLLVNDSASGIPFDDVYEMGEVLGEGGFAFVYRCTHKKNGHEYAVKEILTTDNYQSAGESVRGEINALKLLREGPYVVRLLDVYYEPDRTMMVQEIMKGGDLLDKLTEIEVYEPRDARKVSRTLVEALDYCHKKRICHRDIKPENILLVKDDDLTHIKVADFGCAKKITGPKCLKTLCGSPQYVAPELLTHEDGYNELCDMWSCGVVIYVLLGGYAPFDAPECELAELITAGNYEFHEEYWEDIPAAAKDLIMHLLQVDPDDRYSPSEALDCRWLRRKDKDLASSSMHESNSSFGAWLERRNSRRSLNDP